MESIVDNETDELEFYSFLSEIQTNIRSNNDVVVSPVKIQTDEEEKLNYENEIKEMDILEEKENYNENYNPMKDIIILFGKNLEDHHL